MKKCIALLAALVLLLTGCGSEAPATEPSTTAVTTAPTATEPTGRAATKLVLLLPDAEALNWAEAGEDLKMLLENLYYQVELLYADNDGWTQAEQMTAAIENGADGIILAPVESATLTDACQLASDSGIPIFSYDRLLMDTDAVSYYVSFDYEAIGAAIGEYIIVESGLDNLDAGQVLTAEFFMGSPEDSKALLFYNGLMSQLLPYLQQGVLVTRSGRSAFEDTCIVDWDTDALQETLSMYLKEYYKGSAPDIICTADDLFAYICATTVMETNPDKFPMISGLGGTDDSIARLESGTMAVSASLDLLALNEQLVKTVDDVMTGKTPEMNNTTSCFNNVIAVPAYLCEYQLLTGPE